MDFQRIQLDGFGTLSNLQIDDLTSGLNVYYGANGSGKTTLLHFLRGVICGFDEARRLQLLPPIRGGIPGGSLTLSHDGSRFTVVRRERPGETEALAIQVRQGTAETAEALRDGIERMDRDLVHLLYFVGSYEAHSLSGLVHLACRDGIDLTSRRSDASWIDPIITQVQQQRMALWDGTPSSGVLGNTEANVIKTSRQADNAASLQQTRQESVVDELRRIKMHLQRLDGEYSWVLSELSTVDTDLTDCQTRLWSRRTRSVLDIQRVVQPSRPAPSDWIPEIDELDRQIEHAKQVLRDLAAARLRLTLESTAQACAETPDEVATLRFQRQLLTQLEQQTLQLQGECRAQEEEHGRGVCQCAMVSGRFQQHLKELRETIYVLCQQIGRRETVLNRQMGLAELSRIDQCESEVLERVRRLRLRREELLALSQSPLRSHLRHAVNHEVDHCRCEEHASYSRLLPDEVEPMTQPVREITTERLVEESDARPDDLDRERSLQIRRAELCKRLFDLQRRIRDARVRVDQLDSERQRFADDHSVMDLRFAQQATQELLSDLRNQWMSLSLQQAFLSDAKQRLHRDEHSRVISEASAYLQRLTLVRYTAFQFDPETRELFVRSSEDKLLPPSALSRGTLDQAALSFRLAMVAEYARRGVHLPLVLDDVLVDSDEVRLTSAVDVLQEVAAAGQQVLFLTCQEHLSDLFDQHGLSVRTLGGGIRRSKSPAAARSGPARLSPDVVAHHMFETAAVAPATVSTEVDNSPIIRTVRSVDSLTPPTVSPIPRIVENASDRDSSVRVRLQPEGPYWLRMDSPVSLLPSLGTQMAARLGALGVGSLGDLIVFDLDANGRELADAQVSFAQMRIWQAEARLLSCVPDLTGSEAQLLAAVGIQNPAELGSESEDDLFARIERVRQQGSDMWQPWMADRTDWPDRDRLRNWIRNGRRAMTLRAASQWAGWRPKRLHDLEAYDWDTWNRERFRQSRDRNSGSVPDPNDRDDRSNRRRPREDRPDRLSLTTESSNSKDSDTSSPRFFLNLDDPVVDSPSIGPKMAERFSALGILTVQDFLQRSPSWIVERLEDNRVDADTLTTWQSQSSLMCRVPGLRGHDAMLLVACDITHPEQLSSYSPDGLLAIVGPLAESREGQRMLRSANPPDLDEVRDWIAWSKLARHIRAA